MTTLITEYGENNHEVLLREMLKLAQPVPKDSEEREFVIRRE